MNEPMIIRMGIMDLVTTVITARCVWEVTGIILEVLRGK